MAGRQHPTLQEHRELHTEVRKLALRIERLEQEVRMMLALQSAARLMLGWPAVPPPEGDE